MGCRLTIVYDSEGLPGFETGWGFSLLVDCDGRKVLFDTGWDGHVLRRNLGRVGVSITDIEKVVLSHSHWDHSSGLLTVLSERLRPEPLKVYVPASFSENLKREISRRAAVIEVSGPTDVSPGLRSTGELGSGVKEQSLLITDGVRCIVATGCAHPGLEAILRAAEEHCEPAWLIGGLHGAKADEVPSNLRKAILCHCTQQKGSIMDALGDRAVLGRAGDSYTPFVE